MRILNIDKESGWMRIEIGSWIHEIPIEEFKRMQTPHEGSRDAIMKVASLLKDISVSDVKDVEIANVELAKITEVTKG